MGRIVHSDKSGTKVTLEMPDTQQAIADLGLNPDGEVQAFVTRRAAERMDPFTPRLTGASRSQIDYTSVPTEISYNGPHWRFLYFGVVMIGEHSRSPWAMRGETKVVTTRQLQYTGAPQRGSFWDEKMMAAEGDQFTKEIQQFSDDYSKGKEA